MAAYTVALGGIHGGVPRGGAAVVGYGWRAAWAAVGLSVLLGLAPLAWLLVRRSPEACGVAPRGERRPAAVAGELPSGKTLRRAMSTPAFWVFGFASAVYGLIASGIALFNESILAERGLDASVYHRSLVIVALTSLAGNFLGGWLASKWRVNRLLTLAMCLLAGSLLALPHVSTRAHVAAYAVVMGLAGGFVIVLFGFWSRTYGARTSAGFRVRRRPSLSSRPRGAFVLAECVARRAPTQRCSTFWPSLSRWVSAWSLTPRPSA